MADLHFELGGGGSESRLLVSEGQDRSASDQRSKKRILEIPKQLLRAFCSDQILSIWVIGSVHGFKTPGSQSGLCHFLA